jgi:beta-glucanase (GH16 family)
MVKQLRFLIFILVFNLGSAYGQVMPIDFSDSQDNFIGFGGAGFAVVSDPQNTANPVGEFTNNGTDPWEGFFIDLQSPVDLSQNQILTLSFYQFDSNNHTVIIKLENGTETDVEVTQTNDQSGWTTNLSFDFSNATVSGTANVVNATGTYNRLTIFVDGGINASGTYLIDDISDGSTPSDPNELDVIYTDLVWSDEFDSTNPATVDNTKWYHQTLGPNGGQWFNGEQQHYTDRLENSFVENGFLHIVAKSESFQQDGITLPYTSARLNSKFAFTYGRVDVRAKLPEGAGTWPAIWTLGKNITEEGAYWETQGFGTTPWPACGEIDIMEHGLHSVNEVSSAIHTPSSFGGTINTATQQLTDVANEFHVYSVNWSPNQITFLIDGVGYYTYNPAVKDANTWPFDLDQYLLLNVAMGGAAGAVDTNFTESAMVVDYVRVFQNGSLSLDEVEEQTIRIYPNPSASLINIQSDFDIVTLELYTIMGQRILKTTSNFSQIDISDLDAGIYSLRIFANNGRMLTKKLLKTSN